MGMRFEWLELDDPEPEAPSLTERLLFRFWLWRMRNPEHHTLVVAPKLEDEGTWGTTEFDANIGHPDECYSPLDMQPNTWRRPMMWARCGMEEQLEFVEPGDWPDPPFRTEVHIHVEQIRGFDWVEYDAWLEPLHGWEE